jgi:hypothetical protein
MLFHPETFQPCAFRITEGFAFDPEIKRGAVVSEILHGSPQSMERTEGTRLAAITRAEVPARISPHHAAGSQCGQMRCSAVIRNREKHFGQVLMIAAVWSVAITCLPG